MLLTLSFSLSSLCSGVSSCLAASDRSAFYDIFNNIYMTELLNIYLHDDFLYLLQPPIVFVFAVAFLISLLSLCERPLQ